MQIHDIENKADIELLIDKFYTKVVVDPLIGYIFTEIISLSWDTHIPIMNNFWNSILLGTHEYSGNPMIKHVELNSMYKLESDHFERWLELWQETVRENFTGAKADEAIIRAKSIATMIQIKIANSNLT